MQITCDLCKVETNDITFDDTHGAIGGSMYGFFCGHCFTINDLFWKMDAVKIRVELEIVNNKRAFNRYRKELRK